MIWDMESSAWIILSFIKIIIKEKEKNMQDKPFWEQSYSDYEVSHFSKGPTVDVEEFYEMFPVMQMY